MELHADVGFALSVSWDAGVRESGGRATVSTSVILPAYLDAEAAEALIPALRARLADGAGVALDASAVRRVGTPALQVLLSAATSARAAGQAFGVTAASDEFAASLKDLGLSEHFAA
jgi:anti-anti-sigma regulatory factor